MQNPARNLFDSSAKAADDQIVDNDDLHEEPIVDNDDLHEEPSEAMESAPPLSIGEERVAGDVGDLKKRIIRTGDGWETPLLGDDVTVYFEVTSPDPNIPCTRELREPITLKLGRDYLIDGFDQGLLTMKKNEVAEFDLPRTFEGMPQDDLYHEFDEELHTLENSAMTQPDLPYSCGPEHRVASGAYFRFEVELISWQTDICKDGGLIKQVISQGVDTQIGDLDEVTVKYQISMLDGKVVAETPLGGFSFCVNQGHFCPAISKIVKTMRKGEKALVTIQPQYAFGEAGREANLPFPAIPSNAVLNADIELVSLKPVVDVMGDMIAGEKRSGEGSPCTSGEEGKRQRV